MTTATATRTIRQTHLRILETQCPAFAYAVSVEGREGPQVWSPERGQAVHEFFQDYVEHLFLTGRQTDFEGAGRIVAQILLEHPGLTYEERQDTIEQAKTISDTFLFNRDRYYGAEESFSMDVTGPDGERFTVTGRVDYLEVDNEEGIADLTDWKSNHQIIPDSKVKDDFQGRTYSALVLDNLPELEAVRFHLGLSRYGIFLPQKGEAVFTREDAEQFKEHLGARLAAHFAGRLKSEHVPGTWCQYCPLKRINECTLYRSYYGTTPPPPLKPEQALKLARQIVALEDARETRIELLKQYVNENGAVALGSGSAAETFDFHKRESEEITATALMEIIDTNYSLLGEQPLDDLLAPKKTTKAYKRLRYHPELKAAFEDVVSLKVTTTFGHKAADDGD